MKPPSGSNKITKAWLEYIFTNYEGKKQAGASVTVRDFCISKGTDPGDGFNSELVLVECHGTVKTPKSSNTDADVTYKVAAKFFSQDPFSRVANKRTKSNIRESLIYTKIINELNDFQEAIAPDEPKINIPELIYGVCNAKEFALVMENLKVKGYKTNDKKKGLDYVHTIEAVSHIARIHAVSYAFNASHNFLEKYPDFMLSEDIKALFKTVMFVLFEYCIKFLRSLKDKEDLAKRMEMSLPSCMEKFSSLMQLPNVCCLTHGDYWNNNFMFKHQDAEQDNQEEKAIQDMKVIDWGNGYWGNPLLDLHYLLHTSTLRDLRENHLEEVLQHYHSTFISITTKLGVSIPNWTYEDFKKEWERTSLYGIVMGIALTQGTLSQNNPANKVQAPSADDNSSFHPIRNISNGLKTSIAKLLFGSAMQRFREPLIKAGLKKQFEPICRELIAGTNEVMNTRLLDLLNDADEKGIFNAQ